MEPFRRLTSPVVPLPRHDINTDDIIPAQYLKGTDRRGLAQGLFARWRYRDDGSPDPNFPLNDPRYQGARILLAGANFGSGSSREHAVWALMEWGFRAVLAPSFADIFFNNAVQNGLLPARISQEVFEELRDWVLAHPGEPITLDLETQTIQRPDGKVYTFDVDAFTRIRLLQGLDELDYLLAHLPEIEAYE
ncbi:MAG: 3-isopropylmalate dehydratase small subunit, partial [Chloroflexi bacterium]|nr:3-isopropylmalate dehydratase small subunit [Chloroflexota bacterium]